MKANTILDTIGNTPHIRVQKLFPDHEVWIKSERSNPGGSIKDRIALSMIEAAERDGQLKAGGTIIEPTSGNTGVGLAMVAAVKGYKLVLVMPESMSLERRRLMLAYGATFDLTPREKGMKGAIERAIELVEQTPGAWMPQQFENPANIDVHVRTTAQEILDDFREFADRRHHHRRRDGRPHHRRRGNPQEGMAGPQGLCRRAGGISRDLRRPARPASDPGHRRRLCPGEPPYPGDRRRDQGRRGRFQGHGAPRRLRGRHAGGDQLGRDAGGDRSRSCPTFPTASASWDSITTPASAICPCRTSSRKVEARAFPPICPN